MKKFLFQTIIFLSVLLIIDRSFLLFRINETNIFARISTEKMECLSAKINSGENPDVFIAGASHAEFGISPEVLSKNMEGSFLNIAYGGGANIGTQLTMLRKLINTKKKIPKLILFDMNLYLLNKPPYYSDQYLKVLFNESYDINGLFDSKMFQSYFQLYSRFIPRYIKQVKKGNYLLPYFDKKKTFDLTPFKQYDKYEISETCWAKGFGILNKKFIRAAKVIFSPQKDAVSDLDKYVSLCKKNKIKIIFIQIPEHAVCLEYDKKFIEFDSWMKQYSAKSGCTYWNFNNSESFPVNTDSLFFDSDHLSKDGAELFTIKLTEELKKQDRANWGL